MFKNYLQVALRSLLGNKLYSAINIAGLAVGLAACILIALFVRDELSYDQQWEKADRLYRLHTTFTPPGREPMNMVKAPGPAKAALKNYFGDDVVAASRIRTFYTILRHDDKVASERIHWTDPETADLFDFTMIAGDMHTALGEIANIAVNRSFAERYFGSTDAIGQVVNLNLYDITRDYKVAAVFEDLPHNTVLDIRAFVPIEEADFTEQGWEFAQWFSTNSYLFFELREGQTIESINARAVDFIDTAIPIDSDAGVDSKASSFMQVHGQRLTDIQLYPQGRTGSEMKPTGSMTAVVIFTAIAGLILLIACINFMNLATAKSTQRAREVALRKVLGAHRLQLITQFLGESILIAFVALALGVVFVEIALEPFGAFLGKDLVLDYTDGWMIGTLLTLIVTVGAVGGLYPALILSGFLPARVLKANKSAESNGSAVLRNALVVVQFSISIGLIVATSVVFGQRLYATSKDPGFAKDNILVVNNLDRTAMQGKEDAFRQRVAQIPGVTLTSLAADTPANGNSGNTSLRREGDDPDKNMLIGRQAVDHEFFDLFEVNLLAGRFYSKDRETDGMPVVEGVPEDQALSGTLVINEAAARRIGFASAEEAIGERLIMGVGLGRTGVIEIIGVIADMQFQSMRESMRPEMYQLQLDFLRNLSVKFEGYPAPIISQIEQIWTEMAPTVPFSYDFIDERIRAEFAQEQQQSVMLAVFAGLAIIVACLGLYGLASFAAARRTKEIGIRKVMGATVIDIVRLLLWQFSKPILLANLIAWPLVAWGMINWLQSFPTRLDAWVIAPLCFGAGILALMIAWATVGGNAAKVARANPIKALRYE